MEQKEKDVIDLGKIMKTLWGKRKVFFIVWVVVFALSCLWILPEPRYYNCEVSLAPEGMTDEIAGGLADVASSFGVSLGGSGNDAIYPMLYPDLLESNEFIVSLMDIKVKTEDGTVNSDYYTYLSKHQKKNMLKKPFNDAFKAIKSIFTEKKPGGTGDAKKLNPFMLSEYDFNLIEKTKKSITCSVDKKTEVITLNVRDQDRVICATLADSIRQRLQNFITKYRTSKARLDVQHYQNLADSTLRDYNIAVAKYSAYCDANQDIVLQSSISERDKLESDMQLKYNTYTAMQAQLEAMKAKVQEKTPAFTTLKSATVPIKPSGPKRMIFVAGMLILATIVTGFWLSRKVLFPQKSITI